MLERCRFRFLSQCSQARHVLVLGDGDGRFTAHLLAANPTLQVDAARMRVQRCWQYFKIERAAVAPRLIYGCIRLC